MDGDNHPSSSIQNTTIDPEAGFRIKGAASRSSGKQRQDIEACSICLEPISERAITSNCNHASFDFLCLVSWLQEHSRCPLCNATVTEVQYDFRSPEDFKRYHVPPPQSKNDNESSSERSRRRRGRDSIHRRSQHWMPLAAQAGASGEDPALERRRRVYRDRMYSLHVGANRINQYLDFTPQDFAESPVLQSAARMFLRRELKIFTFLDAATASRGGNREFLLEYVVAILRTNELKGASGHAEDLLTDYLGRENARLLLHELEAWLRSPFRALEDWDRRVQYASEAEGSESKHRAL